MSKDNKFVRSLIENAQHGNNAALDQLFEMNLNKIYAISLRLSGSAKSAEKISGIVMLKAWKEISKLRADVTFTNWMRGMTIFSALDYLRNNPKEPTSESTLKGVYSQYPLEKAINSLPDDQRIPLVLKEVEKYHLKEISDLTMKTESELETDLEAGRIAVIKNVKLISNETELDEALSKLPSEIEPDKETKEKILKEMNAQRMKLKEEIAAKKEAEQEDEVIEVELEDKKEKKKEKKERSSEPFFTPEKVKLIKTSAIFLAAASLIIIAILFLTQSSNDWKVLTVKGAPKADGRVIEKGDELETGKFIVTSEGTSLSFEIPEVGSIKMDENSSLKRPGGENTIEVLSGSIRKNSQDALQKIKVITPAAEVEEYYIGSRFEVVIDDLESTEVRSSDGWIKITAGGQETLLPQGFTSVTKQGTSAGLPFNSKTDPEMREMLINFSGNDDPNFGVILLNATLNDALAIWHLFKRVGVDKRVAVYNTLIQIIPPPDAVSKSGVLSLDEENLKIWLEEIEWNVTGTN